MTNTRRIAILTSITVPLFAIVLYLDYYLTTHFEVLNGDLFVDLVTVSVIIRLISFVLLAYYVGLIIYELSKRRKSKILVASLIVALVAIFFFVPVIHLGTLLAPRQVWISLCDHGTCACIIFGCYTGDSWCSISYRLFGIGEYYVATSELNRVRNKLNGTSKIIDSNNRIFFCVSHTGVSVEELRLSSVSSEELETS